jgi:hypothetical protein
MSARKPKADTNYAAVLAPFLENDRSFQADMATTLAADDKGHLSKAFREQKLDPANPWHWRQLLEDFAAREYGYRSAGRPEIPLEKKIVADRSFLVSEAVARKWLAISNAKMGHSQKKISSKDIVRFLRKRRMG